MPFPWSKKVVPVKKEVIVPPPEPEVVQIVAPPPSPEPEVVQTVEIPTVDDKISVLEHKNGE